MLYSFENRDDFGNLKELVSLQSQVKALRFQDKLGKRNFHEDTKKVFEPVTDIVEDVYKDVTKTMTETSIKNNKALEKLNDKLLELLEDSGMIAHFLCLFYLKHKPRTHSPV